MSVKSSVIEEGRGPLIQPLPFSDAEYADRLTRVRGAMESIGLDAFVSFTPENIYYVTGHDTPGYYFYQACVITATQPPVNVLRGIEAFNTLGASWARRAVPYGDTADPVNTTLKLLAELGVSSGRVGAEEDAWFVSPRRYAQLGQGIAAAGGTLVGTSRIVEDLRMVKSAQELDYIRQSAHAVARGMQAAISASHVGGNENEVAAAAVGALILAGSEYPGLPPFITSGPRSSMVHTTWSGRVFEPGDVLYYELPAITKRYCAALLRCGTAGEPPPGFLSHYEMVRECLENVIDAIRPGRTVADVHKVTRETFTKHGYGHLQAHRTGYSVGVNYPPDWGEGQIVSIWDADTTLQPGMTFHLIPGFFELGKYAVTVSETVAVTSSGCETLTQFPREPFVA